MKLLTAMLFVLIAATQMVAQKRTEDLPLQDEMVQDLKFSGPGRKAGKIIKAELALTDKQSKQLLSIHETFHTQARNILHNSALTAAQKQAQINKRQQERENSIKGLLSADQYKRYQLWNIKRQERLKTLKKMEDRQLPGKMAPGKS